MLKLQNKYTKKEFASFVKKAREISGLSQRDFAKMIGVEQESIRMWERQRRMPYDPYAIAYEIIEALETTVASK